jgi:hypothetical protein
MAVLDTLSFSETMVQAGMPDGQAKALARALQKDALADLVTKQDLGDALEKQTLRMSLIVGTMLVAAIGVLLAAMPLLVN